MGALKKSSMQKQLQWQADGPNWDTFVVNNNFLK